MSLSNTTRQSLWSLRLSLFVLTLLFVAGLLEKPLSSAAAEKIVTSTITLRTTSQTQTDFLPDHPLLTAASTGAVATFARLLEDLEEDINSVLDEGGRNALILGIVNGQKSIVSILFNDEKHVLDPNQKTRQTQHTALIYAAAKGYGDIVNLLLESGGTETINHALRAGPFAGYTALHFACAQGHIPVALSLLHHGANPLLLTSGGRNSGKKASDLLPRSKRLTTRGTSFLEEYERFESYFLEDELMQDDHSPDDDYDEPQRYVEVLESGEFSDLSKEARNSTHRRQGIYE